MRYRLVVLTLLLLLAVLPVMEVLAAPAPDPSAVLDIGPSPEGKSPQEYCQEEIYRLTNPRGYIGFAGFGSERDKLPSATRLKGAFRPWIAKHIRVTPEDGGRRLRLTFRAGDRTEQVVILNALVDAYFQLAVNRRIKSLENALHVKEKCVDQLQRSIKAGQFPHLVDSYQKGINNLCLNDIPALCAEIARLKQVSVIKCAK